VAEYDDMMAKTYEQYMQELRAGIPQGGTQSSVMKPIQQGVDLEADLDVDSDRLQDLDIDMDTDAPAQESVAAGTRQMAGQRPGGSATYVPGSGSSSKGGTYGGATTQGTSSGGKGGELPPTRGTPKDLKEYENRMVAEYRDVGEKVVRDAQGKDAATDFLHDEGAQAEFAQKAALQEYDKKSQSEAYASQYRTIGGAEVEVFVFDDGSEYYVDPDADPNDLQSGDVIRIEVPSDAR